MQKQQNKFVILSKVSQIELKASTLSVILDNLLTLTIARELSNKYKLSLSRILTRQARADLDLKIDVWREF